MLSLLLRSLPKLVNQFLYSVSFLSNYKCFSTTSSNSRSRVFCLVNVFLLWFKSTLETMVDLLKSIFLFFSTSLMMSDISSPAAKRASSKPIQLLIADSYNSSSGDLSIYEFFLFIRSSIMLRVSTLRSGKLRIFQILILSLSMILPISVFMLLLIC